MSILITGGAGYIGSHTCVTLLEYGYDVVILDSLQNSNLNVIDKIEKITNKRPKFYSGDMNDKIFLDSIFTENEIDAVIHFAGVKVVDESLKKTIGFYKSNSDLILNLCDVMSKHNCKKLIFSSTAAVYGDSQHYPINEKSPLNVTKAYGKAKLFTENILRDIAGLDEDWSIIVFRFFNPIGAHISGIIGDNGKIPSTIMPYITQVASKEREYLGIYGDDYNTPDGTCLRDYIHICDAASSHINALKKLNKSNGIHTYNIASGKGYSVLDLIKAFERANNIKIPYRILDRRQGDVPINYADISLVKRDLGFKITLSIEDMCRDSWNFTKNLLDN